VDDAKFEMSIDLLAEDDMIKRPPDCSLDFPTRTDNKRRKVDSKNSNTEYRVEEYARKHCFQQVLYE
jgi:hypothetical protein